jgi:hypothetical protein
MKGASMSEYGDDYFISKPIEAFVGVSNQDEGVDMAIRRAAELASNGGYRDRVLHIRLEVVPGPGQWVRVNRAIATPGG